MSIAIQLQHDFYDRLMESQYQPPEKRTAAQRAQLERLIRHARAQAPFYAERFNVLFAADDTIDWDKWTSVPVLRRSDLLQHRDAMLARELPAGHGQVMDSTSSGSTGAPITVSDTFRARMMMAATLMRSHTAHGMDPRGAYLFWFGDDPAKDAYPDAGVGPVWGPPWEDESTGHMRRLNRFTPQEDVLRFIRDQGVPYLSCRPIAAQALALEAARSGGGSPLRAIIGFGTGPRPQERDDCHEYLGARLIGAYSSKEGHNIAFECSTGTHLHVNEEAVLLELLNDQGLPCAAGEVGHVVLTNLYNFAQPIVRYDQGDLAVWGSSACGCGRTLKVLDHIVGRTVNLFRFPDGRKVAPFAPPQLSAALGARYVQLAQVRPLEIEVRYVPQEGKVADTDAAVAIVRRLTHPEATVRVLSRPDLVRLDGGKFMESVCELDAPDYLATHS